MCVLSRAGIDVLCSEMCPEQAVIYNLPFELSRNDYSAWDLAAWPAPSRVMEAKCHLCWNVDAPWCNIPGGCNFYLHTKHRTKRLFSKGLQLPRRSWFFLASRKLHYASHCIPYIWMKCILSPHRWVLSENPTVWPLEYSLIHLGYVTIFVFKNLYFSKTSWIPWGERESSSLKLCQSLQATIKACIFNSKIN